MQAKYIAFPASLPSGLNKGDISQHHIGSLFMRVIVVGGVCTSVCRW